MTVPRVDASPWAAAATRAETLRERHGFAAEQLTLYLALLDVWEESWREARDGLEPARVPEWAVRRVLPRVVAVTTEAGPRTLAGSVSPAFDPAAATDMLSAWLAGEELVPVERYLARATLRGPMETMDAAAVDAACAADPAPRGGRRCPVCGGPPQLSVREPGGDRLASGARRLSCARCGHGWKHSATACPSCGEDRGAKRTIYAEHREGPKVGRPEPSKAADGDTDFPLFPHLRVETCASCMRYVVDVDLGTDPKAVPEVDELVALPLSLHAAEHGHSKITPNVLGL